MMAAVIEATSGNTGIALALIARLFNLEIELALPSSSTRERLLTMQAFGLLVVISRSQAGISAKGTSSGEISHS